MTAKEANMLFHFRGFLAHNNKLYNATCSEHGGFYNFDEKTCRKCGKPLVQLTTTKGVAMTVSEGSFYPAIGPDQEKNDRAGCARRNRHYPVYRFQMYSFADEQGNLAPHTEHYKMRKGVMVEIETVNHNPFINPYVSEKFQEKRAEMLFCIYPQKGDYAKALSASDTQKHTNKDTDDNPAPVTNQLGQDQDSEKTMNWKNVQPDKPTTGLTADDVKGIIADMLTQFAKVNGSNLAGIPTKESTPGMVWRDISNQPDDDGSVDPFEYA